jgi:hypothetical protein
VTDAGADRLHVASVIRNLPELLLARLASEERVAIFIDDERGRYVQFLITEDHHLIVECESNHFLQDDDRLSLELELILLEAGFAAPGPAEGDRPNWRWTSAGVTELLGGCRMAAIALREVFGLRDGDLVTLTERLLSSPA